MKTEAVKSFFLYCTLTKEEFEFVRPLVHLRNRRTLRITSLLGAGMGLLFFLINWLTHAAVWLPYLFLFCGSSMIYGILRLSEKERPRERPGMLLCYVEMLLLCVYAGILSTQRSNYAVPATSIIVFISLLPLSIDDRPAIMYAFMILESGAYLLVSRFLKSPDAFSLDVINTATFCVVGMILYGVICVRNVREIYQGLRVEKIQQSIISSLATVVEERDSNTGGHIQRTGDYVRALVEAMKKLPRYAHLPEQFFRNVVLAAPMHDIGKIRIPDAILNKPGKLTEEEFSVMKKHAAYGEEIIQRTMKDVEEKEYFTIACNIARYHHERYDGKGYPSGLQGENIPLEARIMALADVYDALVSERVYKKAFPREKAREIIQEGAGTQFDPELVPVFLQAVD